jgi:hypothetical protein
MTTCRVRWRALWMALLISSPAMASAATAQSSPQIGTITDPTVIKLSPNKTEASAHLILTPTATANGELPALFLRAYPAKLGDNYAPITFPTNAGRDWYSLPAQNGPQDIALDLGNITVPSVISHKTIGAGRVCRQVPPARGG